MNALNIKKSTPSLVVSAIGAIALFVLTGCVTPPTTPFGSDGKPTTGYSAEEAASVSRAFSSPSAAVEFLSNTTVMTLGGGHGTQIEYLAPNGTTSLWYPRNAKPVPGRWKIAESTAGVPVICFLYGANTYNPVTREAGGVWECSATVQAYLMQTFQIAAGDPFKLASGRLPFVMPTEDEARRAITFGTAKELGGPALSGVIVRYKLNRFTID